MKAWYCLKVVSQAQMLRDKIDTEIILKSQGYEIYYPLKLVDKRKNRKTDSNTEPFFPCYMFIRMSEGQDDWYPVKHTPGVVHIVKLTEREIKGEIYLYPTQLDDSIVENLREIEDKCGIHATKHDYYVGDNVWIKSGVFGDYKALIQATGDDRVTVLLDFLGKKQPIKMAYHEIEPT